MAAGGYPGSYEKGKVISGLEHADSNTQKVFHAGTASDGENVTTAGGRVLCVVGLGGTVASAAEDAYAAVDKIDWENVYFRRDIGHRAIAREET
jgi:phosphoribosylamine--glycine ligase